jgi:hypothetical protein
MKARWTREDVTEIRRKPLSFEARDIELIYAGLEKRARREIAGQRFSCARAPPRARSKLRVAINAWLCRFMGN